MPKVNYNQHFYYSKTDYIPSLIGINVTEVAHDIQMSVSSYISKQLQLINSYDTWHDRHTFLYCSHNLHLQLNLGTKNVEKEINKITKGPKTKRGVTWFPKLVDKGV